MMGIDFRKIFFENLGLKQTIFKNISWLALAEAITRLLKLGLIVYVARILGVEGYGQFTFALVFISLLGVFSDFGLSTIVIRELSQKKEKEKEFPALLTLKILLSLATLVLIIIGSFFITKDFLIRKLIWILAFYFLFTSFSQILFAFLKARQRMEYEALARIFQALLITGIGLLIILTFPSAENLAYAYFLAGLLASILIFFFFHFKIFSLSLNWQKDIWQKFLFLSWPLGLISIFAIISRYTGTLKWVIGK